MKDLCLVARFKPQGGDPLPSPTVVATITGDRQLLGNMKPRKVLETIAHKLGLLDFEIVDCEATLVPGTQLDLFQTRVDVFSSKPFRR